MRIAPALDEWAMTSPGVQLVVAWVSESSNVLPATVTRSGTVILWSDDTAPSSTAADTVTSLLIEPGS